jgi:hypothetical protein
MSDARLLAWVLTDPARSSQLREHQWQTILTMAQAERLLGSLAHRLAGLPVPEGARRVLDRARLATDAERTRSLWEAEMARRALANVATPVILLKGTAYAAAGLAASQGRHIGDLDILVPRDRLDAAQAALLAAGWEWVKPDPYDDAYYRAHMHELPPLIHRERDGMIDVHHTILPLTARVAPDAAALIEASAALDNGLRVLSPEDMVIHAVAHLFADGDLSGGLRNLWDIDRMLREFGEREGFWPRLLARSRHHGLTLYVSRALRLSRHLFETPVDNHFAWEGRKGDIFYTGRLLARDGWGGETRKLLRFAFYVRSHWIRMPPIMLARHLWTKWRKGRSAQ